MKKYLLLSLVLAGLFLAASPKNAYAGVVYGESVVGYDSDARVVYGYSATWTDYDLSFYYDPVVKGELYWQYDNEVTLDHATAKGYSDPYDYYSPYYQYAAEVFLFSSSYRPVTTYETYSHHSLSPYYVDDYGYFYDPFQYFSSSGGLFGGYFGLSGFGYNPYNYIYFNDIYVFSTDVFITTPSDVCRIQGTQFDEVGRPCTGQAVPTPTPPSSLTVTIQPITAVAKNGTVDVKVEVAPAGNQTPITLSLATDQNTSGLAKFSDDSTSKQITQTTTLTIKGVTESSQKDNVSLTATINNNVVAKARIRFSVLWVVLSFRYGNNLTISEDNSAKVASVSLHGTASLGLQRVTFPLTPPVSNWGNYVEIVGNVSPHDFTGNIVLNRRVDGCRDYSDKVIISRRDCDQHPDPSNQQFRDDDPQSGGSNGKVYDLDGPGIGFTRPNETPVGRIARNRTNFREWAMFGNVRVSDDLQWFSRISIQKTAGGDVTINDPAILPLNGPDNIAGVGTTPLTWNLGPERPSPIFGSSIIDDSGTYVAWQYRDFFDREPDQGGLNDWTNFINGCGSDAACVNDNRAQVALGFMFSSEFMSHHPELSSYPYTSHEFNENFVELCYVIFLRRGSDPGGKAAWTNTLDSAAPNISNANYRQVISGFTNSTEYRVRFPDVQE
jgi:hypothetical protein